MEMNVIGNSVAEKYFDAGFIKFLKRLEVYSFTSRQKRLLKFRQEALERSRSGRKPSYRAGIPTRPGTYKSIPDWMQDQRNQMTGPANDSKLCVKMINSRSPGVMLDLEDSMANTPSVLMEGHTNAKLALTRQLGWMGELDNTDSVVMTDKESPSVVFTRVRGLHLGQIIPTRVRKNHYVPASLFDLAYHFYDMDLDKLKHAPCIYIPKSESAQEALWWRDAFMRIEKLKGWKPQTIKCMALVESFPLAYEIEEFANGLLGYLTGFNLGRWDYMASYIDFNYADVLFPDRNTVPTDVGFFQNLRHRIAQICHERDLLAIGGMTALFPDRKNYELNERALEVLETDKKNEAACLMDGAWTGHPDQNEIACGAFPYPNQLDKLPEGDYRKVDLLSFPEAEDLDATEEGTREAIRTCIKYRAGVSNGRGASLINGYMEDLATDRINRIMIAQRIDHGMHTEDEVEAMFDEELEKMGAGPSEFLGSMHTLKYTWDRQFNPR